LEICAFFNNMSDCNKILLCLQTRQAPEPSLLLIYACDAQSYPQLYPPLRWKTNATNRQVIAPVPEMVAFASGHDCYGYERCRRLRQTNPPPARPWVRRPISRHAPSPPGHHRARATEAAGPLAPIGAEASTHVSNSSCVVRIIGIALGWIEGLGILKSRLAWQRAVRRKRDHRIWPTSTCHGRPAY
jgi:hypothetical protein